MGIFSSDWFDKFRLLRGKFSDGFLIVKCPWEGGTHTEVGFGSNALFLYGIDEISEFASEHQDAGAAVVQDIDQFWLSEPRIERYQDAARLGKGKETLHVLIAVVEQDPNAVPFFQTQSKK